MADERDRTTLSDEDINTTWRRGASVSGAHATDPDSTDADGDDTDTTDSDSDTTDS
jgi:hypothetical protein